MSRRNATTVFISSSVPMVIRRKLSILGCLKYRKKMPCSLAFLKISSAGIEAWDAKTKLAAEGITRKSSFLNSSENHSLVATIFPTVLRKSEPFPAAPRLLSVRKGRALRGGGQQGADRGRAYGPDPARPPVQRRSPSGAGSQGKRRDRKRDPDHGVDHDPELFPALRQACGHTLSYLLKEVQVRPSGQT